jgi:ubiquinone/menaquinone biosynthesis C-methylase UbiE
VIESEIRSMEIASTEDELLQSNRNVWKELGLRSGDTVLFFPAPNALVPIMFARFMNKRKATFIDTNEISVSTLIKLSAQMKLTNVTVKLASLSGKLPVADGAFDVAYSDRGLSYFVSDADRSNDAQVLAKELMRVVRSGGKVAALEDNGAPVIFPCPPEVLSIRSKIEAPKTDRLIMGRKAYSLFKACGLKRIELRSFSSFIKGEEKQKMETELKRRISNLDQMKDGASGVNAQELEKYKAWLKTQLSNDSLLIQFNSILTFGEK